MKLLLDTHVWLWMQAAPGRLSEPTRAMIEDTSNEVLLSAASAWEISIKFALGKLVLPVAPAEYVPSRMARSGTAGLPVMHRHALYVATLPPRHRDPFDRILVAQTELERAVLVTANTVFNRYDIQTLDA